jgi:release factor glutamine methyltransferase
VRLKEALHSAREVLSSHNVEDAHLEAEILLRHLLGINRTQFYVDQELKLTTEQSQAFQALVRRRVSGEPTAYILGKREFYGLDFYVDRRVLIPRPESELLVDKALEFAGHHPTLSPLFIADVGTGCGNLAISLAAHLPRAQIYAVDISKPALEVAAINCHRHNVGQRIHFLHGYLLEPLPVRVHIIVANLPYVKDKELAELEPNVRDFEPRLALAGGSLGLNYIAKLLFQAPGKLNQGGAVFLEIGEGQGTDVLALARKHLPQSEICLYPDLRGIDRVVGIYHRSA